MKNQDLFNEIDTIIHERGYGWTLAQRKSLQRLIGKLQEPKGGYWLNGRFIQDEEVA